jgi:hypothetical protein
MSTPTHSKKTQPIPADVPTVDTNEVMKLLDQVLSALALGSRTLTTKQKRAATHYRRGMEKVIPTLAHLSDEHGVVVPKQPTSQMLAGLALVAQLEPVKTRLVSMLSLVQDNMDEAASGSWNTGTTLYGMLKKASHRDPQLTAQLAPVKEYFAYRTPAAKKAHPKQKSKKAALKAEKGSSGAAAGSVANGSSAPPPPGAGSDAAGAAHDTGAAAPTNETTKA